jgi:type I restriction enzyme, S subunit
LKGLEISEIQFGDVVSGTETVRMDPEYFNRSALETLGLLTNPGKLGDLVKAGCRVVYENTEVIERTEGERRGLSYFLQAADITTPLINAESMVCVSATDWNRYPKGQINPGELLIEVKGNAEKITTKW